MRWKTSVTGDSVEAVTKAALDAANKKLAELALTEAHPIRLEISQVDYHATVSLSWRPEKK